MVWIGWHWFWAERVEPESKKTKRRGRRGREGGREGGGHRVRSEASKRQTPGETEGSWRPKRQKKSQRASGKVSGRQVRGTILDQKMLSFHWKSVSVVHLLLTENKRGLPL